MIRHTTVMVIIMAVVLALVPSASTAQVGPPPAAGQRQRLELERRLQARFGQTVRDQLGLNPQQFQSLQEVMRSFQEERQELNRTQASLRYRLRDPALVDIQDDAARQFLQEMISVQEQELALYRREQEQLLQVLTPAQVVKFYRLREDLGLRVQALRQGRGGGAGPGGGLGNGPQRGAGGGPWPRGWDGGAVRDRGGGGALALSAVRVGGRGGYTSVDVAPLRVYRFREGALPSLFFPMTIRALFFASYRDLLGARELTLELPESVTVASMVGGLRARGGSLARLPEQPVVAVNEEYASLDRVLRDGDVVAFIPPVAGG